MVSSRIKPTPKFISIHATAHGDHRRVCSRPVTNRSAVQYKPTTAAALVYTFYLHLRSGAGPGAV